jgi:3-methyladenine DNA glycosylase AlkD
MFVTAKEKKLALAEIEAALRKAAKIEAGDSAAIKRYMNSKLEFYGLSVPVQRLIASNGFSFFGCTQPKILETWDYIWHQSKYFEVLSQALIYYGDRRRRQELIAVWPTLSKWSERIENWAHSDSLSSIYVQILELAPKLVFPTLQRWNKSPKPWLRRQSIVSILYYSSARKIVLPFRRISPLVKNLIHDEHYYVQKGVGWTLRELTSVHPREAFEFLVEHAPVIHPAAFSAAMEKLPAAKVAQIKRKRKAGRSR